LAAALSVNTNATGISISGTVSRVSLMMILPGIGLIGQQEVHSDVVC
jgi:hypothetical protein